MKAMVREYTHKHLRWVDLESPTHEEVRKIMQEFNLHPLVAEELLTPSLKPKVDRYTDFIYLILHFPAFRHSHGEETDQEVDFIIGRDFLITTHYDTIDPLHKFSKVFEVNSILDRSDIGSHAGYLFFYMIRKLYKALDHELEYLSDSLSEIEARIFAGKEREMVMELSGVSRNLLDFKQAVLPHKDVLESFDAAARRFFGEDFSYHTRSIIGDYYRIQGLIGSHMDTLGELRETNNSLLSTKQNEIMKILTIMTFITAPLALFAATLQIDTKARPVVGSDNDFWIILGIMATATAFFFLYFKKKGWL